MELNRLITILDNKKLTNDSKILLEVVHSVLNDSDYDFDYSELDDLYITGFKYDGEDFIFKLDDDDSKIATVKALKEYIDKNKQLKEDLEDDCFIEVKCCKHDPYDFVENNQLFVRIENGRSHYDVGKVLYREEDYHLIIKAID